jgi:DNA-binding SARP family transcriptional activator
MLGAWDMRKFRVTLFGQTTVVLPDNTIVVDFGGTRPRQVLGILAASVGTPVSKDRLVEQLWEGEPPRTCTDTLEGYVALLRRHIGVSHGRTSPLATRPHGYVLDAAQVEVDLHSFRRLVRPAGDSTSDEELGRREAALDLVTGPLLASEPYADWAADERNRFQSEYVSACQQAASRALELSQPQVAVDTARKAIASDAIAENSWQLLIRGLAATGARSDALRAYLDLRRTLIEAIGEEPSAASQRLYADLLTEDRTISSTRLREVQGLLTLLRDALNTCPHLDLSPHDRRLTQRAERLLAAA